jgi:predicted Zn-dependent protease
MDPASIAFAALAEEYRRLGRHEEAIETCRAGLQRHPAYLSARVTLGRALIETGDYDGAREELETVLRSAPENLAAIRGLAQIHERLGHSAEMDPHLAAMMHAEAERVTAAQEAAARAAAARAAAEREAAAREAAAREASAREAAERETAARETAARETAARETAAREAAALAAVPAPATIAAINRLERFLSAIQHARRA